MPSRRGLIEEALTYSIIGAFFEVHRELGFGFRERIYSLALERALIERGHKVAREVAVMTYFHGRPLARQDIDMIVDDKVVVEVKSTSGAVRKACCQAYSYLWATHLEVGLVLIFSDEAKFYRLVCENRLKPHLPPRN